MMNLHISMELRVHCLEPIANFNLSSGSESNTDEPEASIGQCRNHHSGFPVRINNVMIWRCVDNVDISEIIREHL